LILPWDDRAYDGRMRLSTIGSLLPYHSHVNPGDVVTALNRMIDDASKGKTVFYEFYTGPRSSRSRQELIQGCSSSGETGAPFAVISPGGLRLCRLRPRRLSLRRGDQQKRIQCFRAAIPGGQGEAVATHDWGRPLVHLQRCGHARISTDDYSLWGSSAGARMAAAIGSHGVAHFGGDNLPKPSAV